MNLRTRVAACLLSALTCGLLAGAVPAHADDTDPIVGSQSGMVALSGTVSGSDVSLADSFVSAYAFGPYCFDDSQTKCTDLWQTIDSTDIDPAGGYKLWVPVNTVVRLAANGASFYQNAYGRTATSSDALLADGADVPVGEADITGLDIIVLGKPGIRGTITVPSAPTNFDTGAELRIYEYYQPYPEFGYAGGWTPTVGQDISGDAVEGPDGTTQYRFAQSLPSGTYRLSFTSYWTGTTFFGGSSLETATDIVVNSTGTTIVDMTPSLLPQVSGTVSSTSGTAIDYFAYVVLQPVTPQGTPLEEGVVFARPDADGHFVIPVPSLGDYVLAFMSPTEYGFYGPEPDCFSTQGLSATCLPTSFTVGAEGRTGMDFTTRVFPRISGTVTLPADVDASDLTVQLQRWEYYPGMDEGDPGYWDWTDVEAKADLVFNDDDTASVQVFLAEPGTFRLKFSGTWIAESAVGGDEEPNQDAFIMTSLTSPDFSFTASLQATPVVSGHVNLDIFGGKRVTAEVCVEYQGVNGAWWGAGCFPVDTVTGDFRIAAPPGEFVISLSWDELDENGNSDYCESCEIYYGSRERDRAEILTAASVGAENLYLDFPPAMSPDSPAGGSVISVGDGSATVQWSAPEFDGGSPITSYTARAVGTDASCTAPAGEFTCTITGLENLRKYDIEVFATNSVGDSAPASVGVALPHSDEFQVWLPGGGNVARDGYAAVWLFGAKNATNVKVRIGTQVLDAYPDENGVAILEYYAESGSFGVRSGRLRISASATSYDAEGAKQNLRASSLLVVPSTSVRAKWRAGSTVTVRTRTVAPGTELSYVVNDTLVCDATADDRGRASCTFTASDEGEYEVGTITWGEDGELIQFDADAFTVVAGRRTVR